MYKKYILALVYSAIVNLLALRLLRLKKKPRIALVGHRLNGNLKAFYDYLVSQQNEFEVMFFTDDPMYFKKSVDSQNNKVEIYSLQKLSHLWRVARSQVICTSHGPLGLSLWKNTKNKPLFIELWHGAGFKNRKVAETKPRLFYDAVFVSSSTFGQFHKDWGYKDHQIRVTGYSQIDSLITKPTATQISQIRKAFGLDQLKTENIILYAPTWNAQNNEDSTQFDKSINSLLKELEKTAKKLNSTILVLPHLNSNLKLPSNNSPYIKVISATGDQDIKPLLLITNVLVTDWSSVYTDFIAQPDVKPVIFLDNVPSFYGFTLTPKDRAGDIVNSMDQLKSSIEKAIKQPKLYVAQYSSEIYSTRDKVWGNTLDGKSSQRYLDEIKGLLNA